MVLRVEARIPPLPEEEWSEPVRELLAAQAARGPVPNVFTTLARYPELFARWLPFAGKLLLAGTLEPRERELLILRTASNCGCDYEWGQHVALGQAAGLSETEIARVVEGPSAPGWDANDATLLFAADELHANSAIGEATWAALARRYDERQLIEIPMLVGNYHLVAFCLKSLGVQREPGIASLPVSDD